MSQQINLFNPIFRKRGFEFASARAMLYGFLIVFALAASYGVYQDYSTRETERQAQAVARQQADASALRDNLAKQQAAQKPNAALENELVQLEWRLRGRQDIVETLNSGALGTTAGFADYLRAFSRQAIDGLWLTGVEITSAGRELLIQGRTTSADLVPGYLKRLNQEPALQGRRFAELRISQPKADPAAVQRDAVAGDAKKTDTVLRTDKSGSNGSSAAPRYLEFALTGLLPEAGQGTPLVAAAPSSQPGGGTAAAR